MFMSYSISCNAKLVLQLAQVRGFAVSQPWEVLRGFAQPPTPCNLSLAHFMGVSKFPTRLETNYCIAVFPYIPSLLPI